MNTKKTIKFLDLFAGAGGLSEGFIRAGFSPIAHVESDIAASYTLKTRAAYHWLKDNDKLNLYNDYLFGKLSREMLYKHVPEDLISSVINTEISEETLCDIFSKIDFILQGDQLDLIIGGPPCQAYSLVGRSRDKNGMRGDKRNSLYCFYAEFLKKFNPKYFVFENVLGLLSAKDERKNLYLDAMIKTFNDCGYKIYIKVLSASEFGVLQNRKRVIIVGNKDGKSDFFPIPEKWNPNVNTNEVFNDLPKINAGEGQIKPQKLNEYNGSYLYEARIRNGNPWITFHQSRPHKSQDLQIYRIAVDKWDKYRERLNYNDLPFELRTHNNLTSFLDRFKVVAGDLPVSQTIVAHISKDGHYYIHPDIDQNRSLTPREAARLQTFPDDFFFESSSEIPGRTSAFHQIGNAVPVLLAQKIAEKLWENW
jgi:DNA (cytosine-5)-methyltransferase 1